MLKLSLDVLKTLVSTNNILYVYKGNHSSHVLSVEPLRHIVYVSKLEVATTSSASSVGPCRRVMMDLGHPTPWFQPTLCWFSGASAFDGFSWKLRRLKRPAWVKDGQEIEMH